MIQSELAHETIIKGSVGQILNLANGIKECL